MKIINQTRQTTIANQAKTADTFLKRLKGLIGTDSLPQDALIITQCNSIHMFFMKYSIDVIFVNRQNIVVGLIHEIKPFQMSPIFFGSSYAIELAPNIIHKTKTQKGDIITLQ